jgi:hypothetical protein
VNIIIIPAKGLTKDPVLNFIEVLANARPARTDLSSKVTAVNARIVPTK